MSEERARWVRLGRELRRLRELAGLTQRDMATALEVSQATIDRYEKGGPKGKPPSWPMVGAWAQRAAIAGPDEALLRDMTGDALEEHALYRNVLPGGMAAAQEDVAAEEATARLVRNFNPWGIPGLLQTADYAHHIMRIANPDFAEPRDAAVAVRMRRQEILHEPGRRFKFVVTEWGLRLRPGSAAVQRAQLAQVASLASLSSVTFSVIPAGVQMHALPRVNFILYENRTNGGDPFVAVEIDHMRVSVDKPEDVDVYRSQYDLLQRSAVHGDEAVAFVREVAESLA